MILNFPASFMASQLPCFAVSVLDYTSISDTCIYSYVRVCVGGGGGGGTTSCSLFNRDCGVELTQHIEKNPQEIIIVSMQYHFPLVVSP